MAVVCNDAKSAQSLRDYTDKVHTSIKEGQNKLLLLQDHTNVENVRVIGIVTLENVIERVLLIDINDEKDREAKQRGMSSLTKNDFLS